MTVQQGRSHLDGRSVREGVREHGQVARTPLAAFFNTPSKLNFLREPWIRLFASQ
jgi:hypothetical protein